MEIIRWSDRAAPGTDEIPYDHVIAETTFGRMVISWKGWKEYPVYTLDEHPVNDWYSADSLPEVKEHAEKIYGVALAKATE